MDELGYNLTPQNQELSTNPTADSGEVAAPKKAEKPTIKYIFENHMTRQQVDDEFGQVGLDMFDKANTDGKDGISDDEYFATLNGVEQINFVATKNEEARKRKEEEDFTKKIEVDTEVSMQHFFKETDIKTKAVIKMQNDSSLDKEQAIAEVKNEEQEKNVKQTETMFTNELGILKDFVKELVGHKNTDMSKVEDLTDEQADSVIKALASGNYVRIGMTKEEAEKAGGKILDSFNKISSDGETVTKSDYEKHIQNKIQELGVSNEQIFKLFVDSSNPEKSKEIKEKYLEARYGKLDGSSEFSDIFDVNKLLATKFGYEVNKTCDMTDEEKGEAIFTGMQKKLKEDLDFESKDSAYSKEVERLKNGQYTEFEIEHYGLNGILSAEDVQKYAKLAVYKSHLNDVRTISENIFSKGLDQDKSAVVKGLTTAMKNSAEFKQMLMALGIESIDDVGIQKETSDYVAEKTTDIEPSIGSIALTSTIIKNSGTEAIQEFIKNNASQVETVEAVSKAVLQTMPESEHKTELSNVINTTVENIYNGTIPGYSGSSSAGNTNSDSSSSSTGEINSSGIVYNNSSTQQLTTQEWSANPITTQVNDTRQASNELYQDNGITDYTAQEQAAHHSAYKIGTELSIPEPIRYNPDRIRKLTQDFNNSINEYDKLTSKEQEKVKQYFSGAQAKTIVSIIVSGNQKVQKFLMDYVTTEAIANTIKADEIKNLIDPIKEDLAEFEKKNVIAGIRNEKTMTQAEIKMYELNEKYQS